MISVQIYLQFSKLRHMSIDLSTGHVNCEHVVISDLGVINAFNQCEIRGATTRGISKDPCPFFHNEK